MKKIYLLMFCITLFANNVAKAQCTVDFTTSQDACSALSATVNFTYSGTNNGGNCGVTYNWNFGAGAAPATSAAQNPTVVYSTAGAKSVSLTVTSVAGFGCGGACVGGVTATKVINIQPKPNVGFTSTAPQCVGVSIDFTNTAANAGQDSLTYSWDFGADATPRTSTAQNPKGVVYSSAGTKSVTFQIVNSIGCVNTVTQNITINTTPVADFTSTAPQCTGLPIDFTNTGTSASVNLAWDFGDGSPVSNAVSPTHTFATPGSMVVTLTATSTATGACAVSISKPINIYYTPVVNFSSTDPQCVGAAVDFSNTGDSDPTYSYSWDFGVDASPAQSSSEMPNGVTYASSGTKSVTFKITTTEGCSNTLVNNSVTILSTPLANFTSTAPKCTGDTVEFTNTSTKLVGASYLWSLGSGATPRTALTSTDFLKANNSGVIYSTSGSKIVTLTVTNSSGCSNASTQTININQTPSVDFTSSAIPGGQCVNNSVDFFNTGSTGSTLIFKWDLGKDALPANSSTENPQGVLYSNSGPKVVSFEITSTDGCSNSIQHTVNILSTPTVDFVSTAPECTGLPVDFTNLGTTTNVNWSWNFGSGAAPATSIVQNPTAVYSTAGEKIVTLAITNTITGCSVSATKTIDINQTPTAQFSSNAPQCVGVAVNFTHINATSGDWAYNWDFGTEATPKSSAGENPSSIKYKTPGSKTVSFTVYNSFCTFTATQNININPLPVANAGKDTVICANLTVQLGTSAVVGNTYQWFPTSTLLPSSGNVSNPTSKPISPDNQYILTVTNTTTGCINYDTVNVTMLAPIKADAGTDVVICRYDVAALHSRTLGYDEVQIGNSLIEGQIYQWAPINGILTSTSSSSPYVSPDSTTTYTLTVWASKTTFDKTCGPETDLITVTVHQLPHANAGVDDTITKGASVQLTATGGLQYNWRPSYGLDNIGISTPIANPEYTMDYIVRVTDVYGCIKEDTLLVNVIEPSVWVPNTFSPNGDGKNDDFIVRGEGIKDFEFGVFNRWGEQVFFTKDMRTGWDGTRAVTGEQLPTGAYVYYFKGTKSDGEAVHQKGMVNLVK